MRSLFLSVAATLALGATASAQLDKLLAPVGVVAAAASTSLDGKTGTDSPPAKEALHILTPEEALTTIKKQLQERYSLEGELKLEVASRWARILVPHEYELTIVDYPGAGLSSAFVVRCKLTAKDQALGDFPVALRAQLWREVWVAGGRLDRGQVLDRSLISAQKVDVLRERETLLSSDVDPTIYDLAQSVAPGRPLTRRDVSERPVIHKGEVVEVVARQGTFAIRMKALALEDGVSRALIKMRNIESRKDFTAQVINESQVEVQF
ncbi:MAG TPA: flagellar basal body P-ring formation chaperone FlgA [Chthoniobacterales bacterium]|jgi:flagella basal body P-ring formation protein FlgA